MLRRNTPIFQQWFFEAAPDAPDSSVRMARDWVYDYHDDGDIGNTADLAARAEGIRYQDIPTEVNIRLVFHGPDPKYVPSQLPTGI